MFPTTLSREEAVLDLDAKLADLGVTGEFEVNWMKFLASPATGKELIFLKVTTYSESPRLMVLDAADLSLVKAIQNQFIGDLLFVDMDGYFATGNETDGARFNPLTLELFDTNPPALAYGYQGFTESATSWIFTYTSATNLLNYQPMSTDWTVGGLVQKIVHPTIGGLNLQTSYYEGSRLQLFFSSMYDGPSYIASFPSIASLLAAFGSSSIFEDPSAVIITIPSGDDQSGWLTRNGAIILTHENDTRLVRYESDSGKELDSFTLNDTEDTRFNFSPDGKKWLMYNGRTGKLHLLRTWW